MNDPIEIVSVKRLRDKMFDTPEGRIDDLLVVFNNNTHLAIRLLHNGENAHVSCKFISETDNQLPEINTMDCRFEEQYAIKSILGTYVLYVGSPNVSLPDGGKAYSSDRTITFGTLREAVNYLHDITNK